MSLRIRREPSGMDEMISSVYTGLASRTGDPDVRVMALRHATEVDAAIGAEHSFSRGVLKYVLLTSIGDYKAGTDLPIPDEDSTRDSLVRPGENVYYITRKEGGRVLKAVMDAFGMKWGEGVTFTPTPSVQDPTTAKNIGIAEFNYFVPGAEYVQLGTKVIGWRRANTPRA